MGTLYDHAGASANLNNGTTTGDGVDSYGQSNPSESFVGVEFTLAPNTQINSVVFYGRNFKDGGWFGVNGNGPDDLPTHNDGATTLVASALIAPTLQYTTDGGITWIDDTSVTNDYATQFTGATANNGAATNPATFTLTLPLTGVDGIRLIGEVGGYASGNGGFLGADEIQVFAGAAVPEPSAWALMLGGVAVLFGALRVRAICADNPNAV